MSDFSVVKRSEVLAPRAELREKKKAKVYEGNEEEFEKKKKKRRIILCSIT